MSTGAEIWEQNYAQGILSAWTQNPLVERYVNDTICGEKGQFWLNWVFERLLNKKPVKRLLSIGCGNGGHEILMAKAGYAERIDAFDASDVGIAKATKEARGLNCHFSVNTFERFVQSRISHRYDFILFAGSLHHVRDLEGMCAKAHELLTPDGHVCINEYIGPRHSIYPAAQIDAINAVLDVLAPEYKKSPDVKFRSPTMEEIRGYDPTEGVRADMIPAYLKIFFEPVYEVDMGGALLHPMFDCLNGPRLAQPDAESLVRALIEMDKAFAKYAPFGVNFRFGLYTKKDIV
jgi:2-polyprenyl-3-methyl-5-hydroxy-6-metoxy-1,4-benzoquinol methylase